MRYLLADDARSLLAGGWISRGMYDALVAPLPRLGANDAAPLTFGRRMKRWLGWAWRDPKACRHPRERAAMWIDSAGPFGGDSDHDIACLDCGSKLFIGHPIYAWHIRPSWLPRTYEHARETA